MFALCFVFYGPSGKIVEKYGKLWNNVEKILLSLQQA